MQLLQAFLKSGGAASPDSPEVCLLIHAEITFTVEAITSFRRRVTHTPDPAEPAHREALNLATASSLSQRREAGSKSWIRMHYSQQHDQRKTGIHAPLGQALVKLKNVNTSRVGMIRARALSSSPRTTIMERD